MQCHACGARIARTSAACSACGAAVSRAPAAAVLTARVPVTRSRKSKPEASPVSAAIGSRAVDVTEVEQLRMELQASRAARDEALAQQAAAVEILGVIRTATADPKPVFAAIARNAVVLCDAMFGSVFSYDGTLLHFVAEHQFPRDALRTLQEQYPLRPRGTNLQAIEQRDFVHILDALNDTTTANKELVRTLGYRSSLTVPMLQDGRVLGTIVVYGLEPKPFSDTHIALLRTFADQAVIAIENARLFEAEQTRTKELRESLGYQTEPRKCLASWADRRETWQQYLVCCWSEPSPFAAPTTGVCTRTTPVCLRPWHGKALQPRSIVSHFGRIPRLAWQLQQQLRQQFK